MHHFSPSLTVTFSLVDVLLHLEVQVGTSQVGSCSQELQYILLLHLKDIETSGHRDRFPCVTSLVGELGQRERQLGHWQVRRVNWYHAWPTCKAQLQMANY